VANGRTRHLAVTEEERDDDKRRSMQRGVNQLLFSYLPGRVVDWEDGLAIVQLTGVRLGSAWTDERARLVFDEVQEYLRSWRNGGGEADAVFQDLETARNRFTVGEPTSIGATPLETLLLCRACGRLVPMTLNEIARRARHNQPLECPDCQQPTLRQFGQVFVHGCGELVAFKEYLPWMTSDQGHARQTHLPVRCSRCPDGGVPALPPRVERVSELRISCRRCNGEILDRPKARCPVCTRRLAQSEAEQGDRGGGTIVARTAMRVTNYRANEAYYPHSLSILRLDTPTRISVETDECRTLRRMLPPSRRPEASSSSRATRVTELMRRRDEARRRNDRAEAERLSQELVRLIMQEERPETHGNEPGATLPEDLYRAIQESLAFRERISTRNGLEVAAEGRGASALLIPEASTLMKQLRIRELLLVNDLPLIAATFGYTRRSFEETYEELTQRFPVQLRSFYPLDQYAARQLGRVELQGTIPILAREGQHEGIFLSLEPDAVLQWLIQNGMTFPGEGNAQERILTSLDPVQRTHQDIWRTQVRRWVFGLIHSLSHAAMRVLSRLAGVERTSLGEHIFLPLLGTVIYVNGGAFQLGHMEAVLRDHLRQFLVAIGEEGLACIFDPECGDHSGACPGCLHAPEIACRVFNRGLSRNFLLGGHRPWLPPEVQENARGFWTTD